MNISLTRFINTLRTLWTNSPVSLVLLVGIALLMLNAIWDWWIFDAYENWHEATWVAAVMMVLWIFFITWLNASKAWFRWLKYPIILLLLLGLWIWWRHIAPIPDPGQMIQMLLIGWVGVLWLVGIVLRWTERKDISVHQWILHLIEQVVIAVLFTVLLAWWTSLALMAIQSLFGLHIDGEWFATLRWMSALFLGWVSFMDGVLTGDKEFSWTYQIHKRKRMLSRVLWFLLLVFGVILYVYMAKILITRDWPSNEVSFWAFLYSGLVIVSSIILLPIWQDDNERLITIRRWMYASILPMCVMIAVAIYQRLQQYGFTIERYLVVTFLIWLTVISLLMVFQARFRLWWLFASLMWVWIFSVFVWPLDAKTVSYRDQMNKATTALSWAWMITGTWLQLPLDLNESDEQQVAWSLSYIVNVLGRDLENLDSRLSDPDTIFTQLWIEPTRNYGWFFPSWVRGPNTEWRHFGSYWLNKQIPVSGFTSLYQNLYVSSYDWVDRSDSEDIKASLKDTTVQLQLWAESYEIDLADYIQELLLRPESQPQKWPESEVLEVENESIKLLIKNLQLRKNDDERVLENMDFDVLVR